MIPFNQTKIVCTIGPATQSKEMMRNLVLAGMDTMRLNFSHSTYDEHKDRLDTLNELNEELGTNVAALLDTKGPEIRTHLFKDGYATITIGSTVKIFMDEILGDNTQFSVTYKDLYKDVNIGGTIVVDDGYLLLKVVDVDLANKMIITESFNTHTIKDRRGINIPGMKLNLDYISKKDRQDIIWGCENNVDFIAASFVRCKEDVLAIREILEANCKENQIQIIAKIENQEGVNNLDEITDVADGVMIARGDLGVEVPPEEVPVIQKKIIQMCHEKNKISITATQMLESMQEHPRPTRAEVSDIANAILDGTDAIMLSGESAIGKYPIESVNVMQAIAKRLEVEINRKNFIDRASKHAANDIPTNIAVSVAYSVLQGQANLVITPTVSGNTARLISKFRPNTKILALVPNKQLARSLALNSCVHPVPFLLENDTEALVRNSMNYVVKEGYVFKGDRVILTGGFPIGTKTNSLRILDVE